MSDYDRPPWKYVLGFGLLILLVFGAIIAYDAVVVRLDKEEFCVNVTGTVLYPICERNEHRLCHDKTNASMFLNCDDY